MNLWLKLTELYKFWIWRHLMHFRGFTKPLIFLTKKSIDSISTKTEDGNVRLDNPFVDKNFLFNSEEDLEQIAIEPRFYKKYLDSVSDDDIVYDVGAFHALYGVSPKNAKKVYMFEPDEGNRKIVEKNTILNDSGDFDVIEKAVWSSTGQINFRSESSENSRVDENARAEVETITLDDFQEKEPTPDIIKIDVEGKELEVLKGGEATLKEHQPDIFIEIHYGIEDAVKVSMVDDFMRKHGYSRQFSSDCPPTLQAKYSIDTSS